MIRSRFGRNRSRFGRDSVVIRSRKSAPIYRHPCRHPCRHPADTLQTPYRHPTDTLQTTEGKAQMSRKSAPIYRHPCRHPCRHPADNRRQGANTKKSPIPRGNRARCYRKASCALSLLLAPHASTYASARIVLRGPARQWCIVMPTSDRRHIGRCI